ncbi:MAG: hypothetical protein ACFB15_28125 [Cyclobacteriaceae bacterium]
MSITFLLTGLIWLTGQLVWAQSSQVQAFRQLGDSTYTLSFQNSLAVNREGGHIQGVQWIAPDFLLLSGSSSTVSYYASVKNGQVVKVDTLLLFPYKHAGGFQVNHGLLAVGVEDNEAKNSSQVLIYEFYDPTKPLGVPLQVIKRTGQAKRATAGCVAIARQQKQFLLLVGDWDTRHLDLYQIPTDRISDPTTEFTLVESIALEEHFRDGWIDDTWWPYQNINLFHFEGALYLIGLGINNQKENVADLFAVSLEPTLQLTKIATQTFPQQQQTSFLWGAGVYWHPGTKKMKVLATPYTIGQENVIMVYQ